MIYDLELRNILVYINGLRELAIFGERNLRRRTSLLGYIYCQGKMKTRVGRNKIERLTHISIASHEPLSVLVLLLLVIFFTVL